MRDDMGERVATLEEQHKGVAKAIADHVRHCAKIQTYGLAIGCVTFGLVASDSPKVAKAMQILAKLFLE